MSFLTLEDINTCKYNNQGIYWHELDITVLPNEEFSNIKLDFCNISYSKNVTWGGRLREHCYEIEVENDMWTHSFREYNENGGCGSAAVQVIDNTIHIYSHIKILKVYLLMASFPVELDKWYRDKVSPEYFKLNFKELNTPQKIYFKNVYTNRSFYTNCNLDKGYNLLSYYGDGLDIKGYVYVDLVKSDFKFQCEQSLISGKVNKVALGTDSEYKPDGDMIGEYTPSIRVLYNDETIPVTYDNTLNDYTFDLDLTEETTEHKIHLKVLIDSNEVLNSTSTDVTLSSSFETINTLDKLGHLFNVGGVGRLGSDLTLTDDLTLTKDVYLIGNEHTINMDGHKIIVPSDKIFKAEQTTFTNGENTIQQNEASKVELINCTFTDCTGLGSVIDCQIDVTSLDNPTDFTTTLNKCTLNNNDMCILHGGNLTVTDSTINGKISDDKYPYFLYQTDGEAHITGTVFNLTHNTPITTDIGYNSCIFTIGETANINYGDHKEYSQNNVTGFLENSRNISIIDVTYYYEPIEDYVTLHSNNGYCHSVSSVDFVFKTNVQLTRSE